MVRTIAFLAILILCASFQPGPSGAGAQSAGPPAAGGAHGIRISISLSRRAYPLDALVVATITVSNSGHADRFLPDWPPNWGGSFSPHVRMRTASGRLIYQEELSMFLTPTPGSYPITYILHRGHSLTRRIRFVLQAGYVQAVDRVADGYISFSSRSGAPAPPRSKWATHVWNIASPFISVTLTREPAPSVRVIRTGRILFALFTRSPGATGRPYYMDSSYCSTGASGGWANQHLPWIVAPHDRISVPLYPYCKKPQWWHAVVGWPNHAAAFVHYINP